MAQGAAKGAAQGGLQVDPTKYPQVFRDESVVDTFPGGVQVPDPYRWLEDPDSEETRAFVDAQNALTSHTLDGCNTRGDFSALLTTLYDYPKQGPPTRKGNRYYYFSNSGLQPQSVMYSAPAATNIDVEGEVFLDPNTLSEDGTIALGSYSFSEDGLFFAYALGTGGSDWRKIHVASVAPGTGVMTQLGDELLHVKFSSIAWTHDHKGFFYNRFRAPASTEPGAADLGTEVGTNENQSLWYHRVGMPQENDVKVLELPDNPQWMIGAEVTDDGRYLLLSVSTGCLPANRLWYVDLSLLPRTPDSGHPAFPPREQLPLVKLVDNFDASYDYVGNDGTLFTFQTNLEAPLNRLVRTDLATHEGPESFVDVIPQHEKDLLQWARVLKGGVLVVSWLRDVVSCLELRSLATGELKRVVPLPGIGSVGTATGGHKDAECFFTFTGFTEPGAIYRLDVSEPEPEPTLFKRIQLKAPFNPDDFVTKQVFVTSKDGTQVPMFVVHQKGLALDGTAPALLYGYGGFNISLTPSFSVSRLAFMLAYGGVYAVANLRGGGEYGIHWREAGSVRSKQNVFDDFQAAAEYLQAEGYCSPATTTIEGGSNGGLLVAACANQRPDLYACVLGHVGVMDMLRFHRFTIGHAWQSDFGNVEDEEDFEVLRSYSPLHNVAPPEGGRGQYPAVLLTTGDHDDRVVPLHSHKLAATLQHELAASVPSPVAQRNPLLIRVEVKAGHGAGKPTAKVIEEASDCYAFAAAAMKASWKYKNGAATSSGGGG